MSTADRHIQDLDARVCASTALPDDSISVKNVYILFKMVKHFNRFQSRDKPATDRSHVAFDAYVSKIHELVNGIDHVTIKAGHSCDDQCEWLREDMPSKNEFTSASNTRWQYTTCISRYSMYGKLSRFQQSSQPYWSNSNILLQWLMIYTCIRYRSSDICYMVVQILRFLAHNAFAQSRGQNLFSIFYSKVSFDKSAGNFHDIHYFSNLHIRSLPMLCFAIDPPFVTLKLTGIKNILSLWMEMAPEMRPSVHKFVVRELLRKSKLPRIGVLNYIYKNLYSSSKAQFVDFAEELIYSTAIIDRRLIQRQTGTQPKLSFDYCPAHNYQLGSMIPRSARRFVMMRLNAAGRAFILHKVGFISWKKWVCAGPELDHYAHHEAHLHVARKIQAKRARKSSN